MRACLSIWSERFRVNQNEDERGSLSINSSMPWAMNIFTSATGPMDPRSSWPRPLSRTAPPQTLPSLSCIAAMPDKMWRNLQVILFRDFKVAILTQSRLCTSCTNPIYVFLDKELRGLSPNSYIHVSVSNLYIPRIGCRKIDRLILKIYKSLTDIWV